MTGHSATPGIEDATMKNTTPRQDARGHDAAIPRWTLAFRPEQPTPLSTHVAHHRGGTAITRGWNERDPDRCPPCPRARCPAGPYNVCMVMVDRYVKRADAPLFGLATPPAPAPRLGHGDRRRGGTGSAG